MKEILTLAELRLDTLHQELLLLKDFEKRENTLIDKVKCKEDEIDDVATKVTTSKMKLDQKRKEVEKHSEKEKAILGEFQRLLGENNKFEAYLLKGEYYFYYQIKTSQSFFKFDYFKLLGFLLITGGAISPAQYRRNCRKKPTQFHDF